MAEGLSVRGPCTRSSTTQIGGGDAAAFTPYLKLVDATTKLRIRAAYLNAISVATTGDAVDYDIGTAELFWLDTTANASGVATAAAIGHGASLPVDTSTHGYQPLFNVDAAGAVTSQHVKGSLRHRMCAGTHDFWALSA
ncbi:MAG: hypothetical protein WC661_18860 [Opitutaceae bacterium]|jgi:hypothetical protein